MKTSPPRTSLTRTLHALSVCLKSRSRREEALIPSMPWVGEPKFLILVTSAATRLREVFKRASRRSLCHPSRVAVVAAIIGSHWAQTGNLSAQSTKDSAKNPAALQIVSPHDPSLSVLRDLIEQYTTDLAALERSESVSLSPKRAERLVRFYKDQLRNLELVKFDALDQAGKIDYVLLKSRIRFESRELEHEQRRQAEAAPLIPFAPSILQLEEARRRMESADFERSAKVLLNISEQVAQGRKVFEKQAKPDKEPNSAAPDKVVANRAARWTLELRSALRRWHDFYAGYHPEFAWWAEQPYQKAEKDLQDYAGLLRGRPISAAESAGETPGRSGGPSAGGRRGGGGGSGRGGDLSGTGRNADSAESDDDAIIGDPIGRQALLDALEYEMIPYTPEELIEIANQEFAWCEAEQRRAARDLGFGDDWRKALDYVSNLHVKAGEQPKLIKDLAEEAIQFLESRDLVTVPELCKETWRMEMMSPERQRVNPFFTGGEVISVSYPTATMSYEDKLMSMRGNNVHFSRATVQHELIPGHHLQIFMGARHNTHRRLFRTPFLVEGWALYWEMLLWDLNFPKTAEDRVGMLFWRSHRCARIIFSLNFHLGKMTPQQAVDFLVERVGHERRNATGEVRRSFAGNYGPLYQAAYMLGGLQIRALHKELVGAGKMTNRDFHDAILKENAIPIDLVRASLSQQPLTPDYVPRWKFYEFKAAQRSADATSGSVPIRASGDEKTSAPKVATNPKVYRERVEPHWFAGHNKFWYRVNLPGDKTEFISVDSTQGARMPAFDHERLAKALSQQTGKTVKSDQLPFDSIQFSADGKSLRLVGANAAWQCDLETYQIAEAKSESSEKSEGPPATGERRQRRASPSASSKSPDGQWEVVVRGHNLFLRDLKAEKEQALSYDGNPAHTYARDVYGDRAVGMQYDKPEPALPEPEVYWSPDSRRLVAMRTRPGAQRSVYLVESSPKDQVQPKLQSYPYLKPGDEIPIRKPHLFDIEAGREIPIDDTLFSNPWSISDVRWEPGSDRFTFLYNQRGHQILRVVGVDVPSSKSQRSTLNSPTLSQSLLTSAPPAQVHAIIDEQSPTFIDYSGKFFSEYLDDTGEIIWMSERDGWNHLYLYETKTGRVKNQITKGEWVVRGVDRVDREKRQVWFRAGGIRPGQDPYYIHYARINFDGTGLTLLTEGDGTHTVQYSPDRRLFIDTWSRVDLAPVNELRRAEDGKLVCQLEAGDASELTSTGWRPPERFVAKGRDGVTDIYGIIHWPRKIDPARKYPVIESIYAGPHGSFVPKPFRASSGQDELTQRGFIVVQIDGMGTSNRSKKFHDVCWKNIGDAGFPDRILWMKAAAAKYPSLDLNRVGLYGGSAGGQNTLRGLLAHGDFYKAGASDCGCHDNRMDKIWWNELWMGWPVGSHYDEQSNVTQAHKLQGKLLLTLGELDKNVDPASTMQVVNALIKANKDFDFVIFPGGGHGSGSSPYGRRRRIEFFERHLMGSEPAGGTLPVGTSVSLNR
jgi:dipeptidyl-peptidase-4